MPKKETEGIGTFWKIIGIIILISLLFWALPKWILTIVAIIWVIYPRYMFVKMSKKSKTLNTPQDL